MDGVLIEDTGVTLQGTEVVGAPDTVFGTADAAGNSTTSVDVGDPVPVVVEGLGSQVILHHNNVGVGDDILSIGGFVDRRSLCERQNCQRKRKELAKVMHDEGID